MLSDMVVARLHALWACQEIKVDCTQRKIINQDSPGSHRLERAAWLHRMAACIAGSGDV